MVTDRKYYQLIPEKVLRDLDTITDLIEPGIKGFTATNLKEVISIVACHLQKSTGFAPLEIRILRNLVPQADKYLKGLIDIGVIVREGTFIPGEISYKYRFGEDYSSKFKTLPLNDAKLIRRIERAFEKQGREAKKEIRGRSEQVRFLKMLSIDDSFKDYLNGNYDIETDQYNSVLSSAVRIINRDIFYTVDNTSGRFHSNLTNLSKDLRPFLRIKGEPLVNIDVKNSQPYLSTIILTNPGKASGMTDNPAFALMLQSLKVSHNKDVKKYISLVISGQLYEFLMNEFAKGGICLNRSETKVQVLRILFARNRMPKNPIKDTEVFISKLTKREKKKRDEFIKDYPNIKKAREIFRANFPTVHRIFSKVRGNERGDRFTNFKRFAILLQRIEAYLMLDVILKRIYRELPGTIAVTVHDSIMTGVLTDNVEAVKKIIEEELTFFVGFPPQMKIEGGLKEEREKSILYNQYDDRRLVNCN